MVTSGIRLGTPAGTTRGFGVQEFVQVGDWIADTLESLQSKGAGNNLEFEHQIKQKVIELCKNFPIY